MESQINEKYTTEAPNSGFYKGETLLNIYWKAIPWDPSLIR